MITAKGFVEAARKAGFLLYTGVPCSYLKPFINHVIDADDLRYVPAANEGDAVAIGAGAEVAGMRSVVMFQNSGLGNAVNPLTSLTYTFRLPVLLIVTLRGEPGGPKDEPQHELMGRITTSMLELMEIAWEYFPVTEDEMEPVLRRAIAHMSETGRPYALVMRKGSVESHPAPQRLAARPPGARVQGTPGERTALMSRRQALKIIQDSLQPDDIVVATTGFTGRELYALEDRSNQFYMVGSMGCASSFGLGIALARPERKVVVVDGDGALLMRMGALTTIGYERPANLVHVLLDNEIHESTGGQSTVSASIDFDAIAGACGYQRVIRADNGADLASIIGKEPAALTFVHVKTRAGVPQGLPRPAVTPVEVARRLRHFITGSQNK